MTDKIKEILKEILEVSISDRIPNKPEDWDLLMIDKFKYLLRQLEDEPSYTCQYFDKNCDKTMSALQCEKCIKEGLISKQEVEDALNKCFGHKMSYKGYIQIFPNAIYSVEGKKVSELYKRLNLKNKV